MFFFVSKICVFRIPYPKGKTEPQGLISVSHASAEVFNDDIGDRKGTEDLG